MLVYTKLPQSIIWQLKLQTEGIYMYYLDQTMHAYTGTQKQTMFGTYTYVCSIQISHNASQQNNRGKTKLYQDHPKKQTPPPPKKKKKKKKTLHVNYLLVSYWCNSPATTHWQ